METTTYANSQVLDFYKSLPFNYRESVDESVKAIHSTDLVASYPVLIPLLKRGMRVLEVGCGTGWFSNSLVYRYGCKVTGIDFNPVAIQRCKEVALAAKLDTEFSVQDLFLYEPAEPFDMVISIGVLHHTNNCVAAVRRCCEKFVRPGGHVFIGLYHTYGRKPLLDHFAEMQQRGASEDEMLARYRQLHSQIKDETLLRSWFRDQVLHPHETQHTMEEMIGVLASSGMKLLSTSINKFQPIVSNQELIEEEKKYESIAIQRMRENQYFTGFFVFLAQREGGDTASSSRAASDDLDTKPYVRYHPTFGYEYAPDTVQTLPAPGGGSYTIRINSAGIRSDREYSFRKSPGVFRMIVCGDSMPAGQFIDNEHRFSEILERRIPNLEVINLALEGSGTDQQLLIFEHVGRQYEFDAVMLMPFLQNLRRNMVAARVAHDPKTGERILRGKPHFELIDGRLELRNVPVPQERIPMKEDDMEGTDAGVSLSSRLKTQLSAFPFMQSVKRVVYGMMPWEPFPEYRDANSPGWRLMAAIVRRFKELAGDKPLLLVPTVYSNYIRFSMARNYWNRFSELTTVPGIQAIDLLPYLMAQGRAAGLRCYQDPFDMHFSKYGHLVVADALQLELGRLGLLPAAAKSSALAPTQHYDREHTQ